MKMSMLVLWCVIGYGVVAHAGDGDGKLLYSSTPRLSGAVARGAQLPNVMFVSTMKEPRRQVDRRARRETLAIARVEASSNTVAQYAKLELDVDLRGTWDNPYDPDDVALDALLTTASGKTLKQPGFFMVDQKRAVRGGVETMTPTGNGHWVVRIAATELGTLKCRLIARDRTGTVTKDIDPCTVCRGSNRGFVRRSRVDPHYLQFDSGDGFVPIGHNLPIYHTRDQLADAVIT